MLAGHYSASFAIKSFTREVPLWVLFIAVQLLDVFWTSLLLLGVEKARVEPDLPSVPLDLYYMPYSHSLLAVVLTCAVVFLLYRALIPPRTSFQPALFVAIAVMSHWILDIPVHRADLPLYDDMDKIGFGLWNFPLWALLLEVVLLFVGLLMYLRATRATCPSGKYAMVIFSITLAIMQVGIVYGPRPPWLSIQVTAISLLAYYFATTAVVFWLGRKREWKSDRAVLSPLRRGH